MSEEEKKAISIVENIKFKKYKIYIAKEMKDEIRFYQTEEERKAIDIVLNLIEKLKKENEDLNNRDTSRLSEIGELRTKNNYLENEIKYYYISKEKMREKLEYKKDKLKQLEYSSDRYRKVCLQAEIDVLEELLEEE